MINQVSNLKKLLLQGTKAKCVDGGWSADGVPLPERLLVVGAPATACSPTLPRNPDSTANAQSAGDRHLREQPVP
jgi:hypothetical protein